MLLADYCYIKTNAGVTDAGEQFATTLVAVGKEATPFATEFVASFRYRCGLTKVTSSTYGEASITSLAEKVKDKRERGTISQQATKRSSASMGAGERARWEIHAQTRTMKSPVTGAYQVAELGHAHPILPWIIRHASWLMTRFLVRATVATAYAAVYGEEYRREIVPFGEASMIKIPVPDHRGIRPGVRAHRGDTAWTRAIWLGRSEVTDEHLAGTANGLIRSRTIRRLSACSRADRTLFKSVQCVPWDAGRGGAVKRGRPIKTQPAAFTPALFAEPAVEAESSPSGRATRSTFQLRAHG